MDNLFFNYFNVARNRYDDDAVALYFRVHPVGL